MAFLEFWTHRNPSKSMAILPQCPAVSPCLPLSPADRLTSAQRFGSLRSSQLLDCQLRFNHVICSIFPTYLAPSCTIQINNYHLSYLSKKALLMTTSITGITSTYISTITSSITTLFPFLNIPGEAVPQCQPQLGGSPMGPLGVPATWSVPAAAG